MSNQTVYIGFPIWRGSGEIKQAIRKIIHNGFDFTEIDLETLKPNEINNYKTINIGYHAPYTIPLAHPYLTKETRKHLTNLVKFAEKTNATYINIHMNHPTYRNLKNLNNKLRNEAIKTIKYLRKTTRKTIITLENPPKGDYWKYGTLANIAKETNVKICLDIGHLASNLLKQADIGKTTREIKRYIKQSRGLLFLLHLHNIKQNSNGEIQDHLLEGDLNLVEIAATATETGCKHILLETFLKNHSKKQETTIKDASKLMHRIKRELNNPRGDLK